MKNSYKTRGKVTTITLHWPDGSPIETVIDTADLPLVMSVFRWYPVEYRRSGTFYVRASIARRTVTLHRFLMNQPKGKQVDHADHDGLNNRRSNLRLATVSQNQHNRKGPARRTRSGYTGVSFDSGSSLKPWRAQVMINYKAKYLGLFRTPLAASRAVNKFKKEHVLYEHSGNSSTPSHL